MSKWANIDPELLDIYLSAEETIFKANRELKMLAMRAQVNQNMRLCSGLKQLASSTAAAFDSVVSDATMAEYAQIAKSETEPFDPDKRVVVKD